MSFNHIHIFGPKKHRLVQKNTVWSKKTPFGPKKQIYFQQFSNFENIHNQMTDFYHTDTQPKYISSGLPTTKVNRKEITCGCRLRRRTASADCLKGGFFEEKRG